MLVAYSFPSSVVKIHIYRLVTYMVATLQNVKQVSYKYLCVCIVRLL